MTHHAFRRRAYAPLQPPRAVFAALLAGAMLGGMPAIAEGPPDRKPGAPHRATPTPPDAGPGPNAKPQSKATAPETPQTPEARTKLLSDLYAHLATARDETEAQPLVSAIERLWLYSGSDTVDLLMERAAKSAAEGRPDLALQLLDATVALAPDFAEAWNRRAYVYYNLNDTERALGDLRRVLALEPNHFKALEGLAMIFRETGQKKAAYKAYKEILAINPNASDAKQVIQELAREVEGQGI